MSEGFGLRAGDFFLTFFFNLRGFFFMKNARVGQDVRREHRDPADHSEGRRESHLFVLNCVTFLNAVWNFVWVHLRNK